MLNYNPSTYVAGYAQSNYTQNHPLNSQTPFYNPNEITSGTNMTMRQQEQPYFNNYYYNQSLYKPAEQSSVKNSDSLIMNFPITGGLKTKNVFANPSTLTSTYPNQSVNSVQSPPMPQRHHANQYQQHQNNSPTNQQQFNNYPTPQHNTLPHYQNQPLNQYDQQYGGIIHTPGPVISQGFVISSSSNSQVHSQIQPKSIQPQAILNIPPQTQTINQQKVQQQQQQQQQQNNIKIKFKSPSNLDLLTSLNEADFPTSITEPLSPVSTSAIYPNSLSSDSADKNENEDIKCSIPSENSETDNKKEMKPAEDSSCKIPNPKKSTTVDIYTWDPVLLEKLTLEVEKLENTVESFHKKSLSGPTALDLKWKEIQDVQIHVGKKSISVARMYPMKNRTPDILPYDQTRVPLPQTKDDYINASFIKDLSPNSIPFIVTQNPLPSSIHDFWSMIFHHNIELIVCLTNDSEVKEHFYWPTEKSKPLEVGNLSVFLNTKNNLSNKKSPNEYGIERIFYIKNRETKMTRVVIHLQFNHWISNVFPDSPSQFLSFIYEAHSFYEKQSKGQRSNPIVVHDVAGVGRSGTFILLSACLREVNLHNGIPDIIQIAAKANDQRKGILIDKEYLRFTYQCLLYSTQEILMKHGILSTKTSSVFESDKSKRHHRHPSQDYNFFFEDSVKKLLNTESKSESKTELESSSTSVNLENLEKDLKALQLNASNEEIVQYFPLLNQLQNDSCAKICSNSNPTLTSNSIGDMSTSSASSFNCSTVSLPNTPVKMNTNSSTQSKNKDTSSASNLSTQLSSSSTLKKEPCSSNNPLDTLDPLWNFKK